jgi:biotin synthase
MILEKLLCNDTFTRDEIIFLLNLSEEKDLNLLFKRADIVRHSFTGDSIYLNGLIEFSNYCTQNCFYCGLREDNFKLSRYRMSPDEIIDTAWKISKLGISTITLQSGEDFHYDSDLISFIIYSIKQKTDVEICLSLGERGYDEYRTWKIAGADKYLLKYETSNEKLYAALHHNQKLDERLKHLRFLSNLGYKLGSGSIVGLPNQNTEDLADDLLLSNELGLDLVVYAPFVPSENTPFANHDAGNLISTLKVTSIARLIQKSAHISSVNSIDSSEIGVVERGLVSGANIVFTDLTPFPYRTNYQYYSSKIESNNSPVDCLLDLQKRIEKLTNQSSVRMEII